MEGCINKYHYCNTFDICISMCELLLNEKYTLVRTLQRHELLMYSTGMKESTSHPVMANGLFKNCLTL